MCFSWGTAIDINNFCLTRIYSLAEESTCYQFVKGFLVIGQYLSAKLVAGVIISKLVEQREIDNYFNYLMLCGKPLQDLTA